MPGPFLKYCAITGTEFRAIFDYTHESEWNTLSGEFNIRKGSLRVVSPGEVEYAGDPITANAAIVLSFYNVDDMKLEIRARRAGGEYVCFGLDFESNNIYLAEARMSGGYGDAYYGQAQYGSHGISVNVLESKTHIFNTSSVYYEVGLWLFDNVIMGFINGAYVIGATNDLNMLETGWSIYVPEIYENIITAFTNVQVYSLKEYPSTPTIPDDPNNREQQYRKKLKGYAENPVDLTYLSFWNARVSWENMKDYGMTNDAWSELGYPIYPPMPENWFNS